MADITLSHITPQHFFETVRLLKMSEHRIYLTVNSLEVRFQYNQAESKEETNETAGAFYAFSGRVSKFGCAD